MTNKSPARFLANSPTRPNVFPRARTCGVILRSPPSVPETTPIPPIQLPVPQAAVYGITRTELDFGLLRPSVTEENILAYTYEGTNHTFPKGRYRIVYSDGAVSYNGHLCSLGNAYQYSGYFLIKDHGLTTQKIDLDEQSYATYQEVEQISAGTELMFRHYGGTISLMFRCMNYTNNVAVGNAGTAPGFHLYNVP